MGTLVIIGFVFCIGAVAVIYFSYFDKEPGTSKGK